MSALSKPDLPNETAKTAAPSKPPGGGRPTFRRFLALFAVFCVAAALLPAAASAHDPTRTEITRQEPYQAQEQDGTKTIPDYNYKDVPAYNYVDVPQYEDVVTKKFVGNKKVRIPPYTKKERIPPYTTTKPLYNYETQCIWLGCFQVRVPPMSKTIPLYNYKDVPAYNYTNIPQYEDVVTKKFVGNKKVRIPPYTKKERVAPFTKEVPKYKTVTKYRTVGTGQYTTTHIPAGSHQCPTGQTPTSTDTYGHVSGCKQPGTDNDGGGDNGGGDNDCKFDFKTEHRHDSTNVCHDDHDAEPACGTGNAGQTVTWITHAGDVHNDHSKVCPSLCSYDPNSQHRHDSTNVCHDDHDSEPVCGIGNAGQTVAWITHAGDVHNDHSKVCKIRPPAGVTCPNGYEYGTGTNGWTPPRAAPTGQFWVSTRATPGWPVHECWQLRAGSCPNGQTLAHAIHTKTPNRFLAGYADLPAAPAGYEWNQESVSANADYACYKLVESKDLFKIVVDGVTHWVREGAKLTIKGIDYVIRGGKVVVDQASQAVGAVGESIKQAAIVEMERLRRIGQTAFNLACSVPFGQAVVGGAAAYAAASTATGAAAVAGVATALSVSPALVVVAAGVATAAGVHYACEFVKNKYLKSDDDSSQSVPAPASDLSASAGAGQIAVSWSASATAPAAGFGYRVQWKPTAQAWDGAAVGSEDLDHGSDLATSHTITGLVNGSAYDVRVAAFNANGVSTWITGTATPAKPKPSLAFDSVSCASSGSGWVISVSWSKTPESLKPDVWASEAKNRGHRGFQSAVAGTSTTFDVPNAGWYQVGMQAKIAGNKKVGDSEPVRCR